MIVCYNKCEESLRRTFVSLLFISHYVHDSVIQIRVHLQVVIAQAYIVKVVELIYVLVPAAGKLKDLRADGLVVGGFEELSTIVLQVSHGYFEESTHFECPEREHPCRGFSIFVVLLLLRSVLARPTSPHIPVSAVVDDNVGVHHLQLELCVHGVEHFQYIHA